MFQQSVCSVVTSVLATKTNSPLLAIETTSLKETFCSKINKFAMTLATLKLLKCLELITIDFKFMTINFKFISFFDILCRYDLHESE